MTVNIETLNGLLRHFRNDQDDIKAIVHAMETFEDYQNAIYRLEITRRLFSCNAIESETYRSDTVERDRLRTYNHNAVIAQVNLLNRMAEEASLPPFYGGVVSEEKPYRRELANAILDFIWEVIVNRA